MFHIPGGASLILILMIALLLFGPEKMPEIARGIGKTMSELKGTLRDVTDHLDFNAATNETRHYSSTASLPAQTSPAYQYPEPEHFSDSQYGSSRSTETASSTGVDAAGLPGSVEMSANQSLLIG